MALFCQNRWKLPFQTKAYNVFKEAPWVLCSLILGDDLRPREIIPADGRVKVGCVFKKRLSSGWATAIIHSWECVCVCVCVRVCVCWGLQADSEYSSSVARYLTLLSPFSKNTARRHVSHTYVYIYMHTHTSMYILLSWPRRSQRCSTPLLSSSLLSSHFFFLFAASGFNKPSLSLPQSISISLCFSLRIM